ncbi:MAG: hypothetical protein IPP48_15740 [Chitinophagaceae bacterium]|nr:hypothetical protein [Chitinophagaceae bacterium]
MYVFLKPQESYVHYDKDSKAIKSVSTSPPINEYYTPPIPIYEGYTSSPGWSMMHAGGSVTKFLFGLKLAQGLSLSAINK